MVKKTHARTGLERERARRREVNRLKAERCHPEPESVESPTPLRAVDAAPTPEDVPVSPRADLAARTAGVRLPGQHVVCLWCGSSVAVRARGPLPKFCSANCRHRSWEQKRATRDGRAAVIAVDRFVVAFPNTTQGWVAHLQRLAIDLRRGQLDENVLTAALGLVYAAIATRQPHDPLDDAW